MILFYRNKEKDTVERITIARYNIGKYQIRLEQKWTINGRPIKRHRSTKSKHNWD